MLMAAYKALHARQDQLTFSDDMQADTILLLRRVRQGQQLGPDAGGGGLLHIAVQPAHAPTEEAAKRARHLLAGMQVCRSAPFHQFCLNCTMHACLLL